MDPPGPQEGDAEAEVAGRGAEPSPLTAAQRAAPRTAGDADAPGAGDVVASAATAKPDCADGGAAAAGGEAPAGKRTVKRTVVKKVVKKVLRKRTASATPGGAPQPPTGGEQAGATAPGGAGAPRETDSRGAALHARTPEPKPALGTAAAGGGGAAVAAPQHRQPGQQLPQGEPEGQLPDLDEDTEEIRKIVSEIHGGPGVPPHLPGRAA